MRTEAQKRRTWGFFLAGVLLVAWAVSMAVEGGADIRVIDVSVTDMGKRRVADVNVHAGVGAEYGLAVATTDVEGRARLVVPLDVEVDVFAQDHSGRSSLLVPVPAGTDATVELLLQRPRRVVLEVTGAQAQGALPEAVSVWREGAGDRRLMEQRLPLQAQQDACRTEWVPLLPGHWTAEFQGPAGRRWTTHLEVTLDSARRIYLFELP